ncbi:MAG: phosphatase PAP2 family protein [Paracoccus sp. (in: a-proteobacteria)]|nr:phosphatase PAP2 family protein [Paracoccus sp. (in: a-proteobacteria)]
MDSDGLADVLLAEALLRARDGIVGTAHLTGDAPGAPTLDQGERLARMSADYREAVLIAEIFEDLSFETDQPEDAPVADAARWLRRGDDGPILLAGFHPPSAEDFRNAIPLVGGYADLRDDRMAEILVQTQDLIPFFATLQPLEPERCRRIHEMLEVAMSVATMAVMRIKLALGCPRPDQFSSRIQPLVDMPAHGAFPSGHATQSFLLAGLLTLLNDPGARLNADSQMFRMASRIAVNRTVAGVHYPADSAAGAMLGVALARYLAARGGGQKAGGVRMDGRQWAQGGQTRDFHLGEFARMMAGDDPAVRFTAANPVRPAPLWGWLWSQARRERNERWS